MAEKGLFILLPKFLKGNLNKQLKRVHKNGFSDNYASWSKLKDVTLSRPVACSSQVSQRDELPEEVALQTEERWQVTAGQVLVSKKYITAQFRGFPDFQVELKRTILQMMQFTWLVNLLRHKI